MSELISRPGVVISTDDATLVAASLSRRPACSAGVWRVTTNRWELWNGPAPDPVRLATIDIAHNVPYLHAATLTRVALTEDATRAGLDSESICDLALHAAGKRMADCPRHLVSGPPVFTGRRNSNRSEWEAQAAMRACGGASAPLPDAQPDPGSSGDDVAASVREDAAASVREDPAASVREDAAASALVDVAASAPEDVAAPPLDDAAASALEDVAAPPPEDTLGPRLDNIEDRELRRLHYLATFGGLSGGLAERYAELRYRDRRTTIRDPQDDDLVVLPSPRDESDDPDDESHYVGPVTEAS